MKIIETTTPSSNAIKRTISDEIDHQAKKQMTCTSSSVQCKQNGPKSSIELKFMSATQVAAANKSNHCAIPEISDEELLEMALAMEKIQPQ